MEIFTTGSGLRTKPSSARKTPKRIAQRGQGATGLRFDVLGAEPPVKVTEAVANLRAAFGQNIFITTPSPKTAVVSLPGRAQFRLRESPDGTHAIAYINGKGVDFGRLTSGDKGNRLRKVITKLEEETEAAKKYLSKNGGKIVKASFEDGITVETKKTRKKRKVRLHFLVEPPTDSLPGRSQKKKSDSELSEKVSIKT